MNWRYKAALQLMFSNVPYGEHLNYLCQRYMTKSLPNTDATFLEVVNIARQHINALKRRSGKGLEGVIFFEFGAGATLTIPLAFYALGVDRQILGDITPLARAELIQNTIDKFRRMAPQLQLPRVLERSIDGGSNAYALLKTYYGIDYRAPCDARATRLDSNSVDFITSTNTLEHIPPRDIQAIFRECHRLLRVDGLMSCQVDYHDHYSDFDPNISVYNFLRYSDRKWRIFSPSLHYQNRLRHRDYVALAREGGFELADEKREHGTPADLEILRSMPLDERFRPYLPDELAVRSAQIVLRKRTANDRSSVGMS